MKMPIGIPIVTAIFICLIPIVTALPRTARAADGKSAAAAVPKFLNNLDAGIEFGKSSLGKKPNTLKYDINNTSFYLGKENGSRFYYDESRTSITKDSDTRKFGTRVHAREYGFFAGWRFSAAPKSSFSAGMGRKEVGTDTYQDFTWMPLAAAWNVDIISQAVVSSHPFYFNYAYDLNKATRLGFGFVRESVKLDTIAGISVKTSAYKLSADHSWKKFGAGASLSKYKSDKTPKNSLMEFHGDYKPVKHVDIFLKAGIYSHGAPTAGGLFSDVGEQFIFSYLGGETAFDPIFTQKFGYYSMGVKFALK